MQNCDFCNTFASSDDKLVTEKRDRIVALCDSCSKSIRQSLPTSEGCVFCDNENPELLLREPPQNLTGVGSGTEISTPDPVEAMCEDCFKERAGTGRLY
jgi:hypothetical protein